MLDFIDLDTLQNVVVFAQEEGGAAGGEGGEDEGKRVGEDHRKKAIRPKMKA